MVERSPLTPVIRSSNPVIGKLLYNILFIVNCVEKTKIKKKEAGIAHFKKGNQIKYVFVIKEISFFPFLQCSLVFKNASY